MNLHRYNYYSLLFRSCSPLILLYFECRSIIKALFPLHMVRSVFIKCLKAYDTCITYIPSLASVVAWSVSLIAIPWITCTLPDGQCTSNLHINQSVCFRYSQSVHISYKAQFLPTVFKHCFLSQVLTIPTWLLSFCHDQVFYLCIPVTSCVVRLINQLSIHVTLSVTPC